MSFEPVLFIFSLYVIGLLFALLFIPKLSAVFACLTGFLWGALFYTVLVILMLATSVIPYNTTTTMLSGIILILTLTVVLIRKNNYKIKTREILFIIGYSVILFFVICFFSLKNYSKASFDSMLLVNMGRYLASGDIFNWIMGSPKGYGMLIPILHSSSSFWGMDYYSALQPTISFVFACIFLYINGMFIKSITTSIIVQVVVPLFSSALFFSTPIIWFNTTYIHTNFISGAYLLVSLYAYINGIINESNEWLATGTISIIGFGFCRTENSIFAVLILLLVFRSSQVDFKKRISNTLPYCLVFIFWWILVLQMKDTPYSDLLTKNILYAYIFVFMLFIIGILLSKNLWIERIIFRKIDLWISASFIAVYTIMMIEKPQEMSLSFINILQNSFITNNGGYGVTSYFIAIGLLLVYIINIKFKNPNYKSTAMLAMIIFNFIMFVLIMGFFRTPYRVGWGDSANRMFIALLPISITYIFAELTRFSSSNKNLVDQKS